MAAGGSAAALSTAAGLLMAIPLRVSHDLAGRVSSSLDILKGELLAGKIPMAAAIVVAGAFQVSIRQASAGTVALAFRDPEFAVSGPS